MSALLVPTAVMALTTSEDLSTARNRALSWKAEDVSLQHRDVTDAALVDLIEAAEEAGSKTFGRVVQAIQASRAGDDKAIPSFVGAPEILLSYLRHNMIDGWLYRRGFDGRYWPWLVTSIKIEQPRMDSEPSIVISLTTDYPIRSQRQETVTKNESISLSKGDVARKKPADVFMAKNTIHETPELKAEYEARLTRFEEVMNGGFQKQFRLTGVIDLEKQWQSENVEGRKVVHDVAPSELAALRSEASSMLAEDEDLLPVPIVTVARVFDVGDSRHYFVNVADLKDYKYDATLRDKLILPDDQRELLDVLTSDLSAFTGDLIEGKSAGNVILAKGLPGVGKTLTAEVYAEVVERPLYAIHSGTLGTTAETVRERLESAFKIAKRLNLVLLLDEADVFVLERGDNLQANAICAEFLRTLEYFDGLLFMTTNRADEIDDAILSRCAALIDYKTPERAHARRIWGVLADVNKVTIEPDLQEALLDGLPHISPRDIKMLLRLTVRMATSRGEELTVEQFARCAMFRGLHFQTKEA